MPGSKRFPVKTIKAYLSHLNPEVDALFQRPKDASVRFQKRIASGSSGRF